MNSKASLAFTNLKPVLLGNNYFYPSKLDLMVSCGQLWKKLGGGKGLGREGTDRFVQVLKAGPWMDKSDKT